jgi:hypothetical protein
VAVCYDPDGLRHRAEHGFTLVGRWRTGGTPPTMWAPRTRLGRRKARHVEGRVRAAMGVAS